MTIQERGDALLTAYVNKDFETVLDLWNELNTRRPQPMDDLIALHGYQNQSIAGMTTGAAVVRAVKTLSETGYFD